MNPKIRKEKGILLIHPPAAKACEAPGGPARLAGALRRHGVACRVWDANLEGQIALLESAAGRRRGGNHDTWTRRAAKHLAENLASLRSRELYAKSRPLPAGGDGSEPPPRDGGPALRRPPEPRRLRGRKALSRPERRSPSGRRRAGGQPLLSLVPRTPSGDPRRNRPSRTSVFR